jgi:hypothetical protein
MKQEKFGDGRFLHPCRYSTLTHVLTWVAAVFCRRELPHGDTFSLHIQYKKWLGMKTKHEDIILNPEDISRVYSASERQGKTIIITFSP